MAADQIGGIFGGIGDFDSAHAIPLTDRTIRNAKPAAKPYKLSDGGGLFLLVNPTGSRLWRMKYRMEGREKLLAIGAYPDVPLAMARERRDEARKVIAGGGDPSALKKQARTEAKAADAEDHARLRDRPA